MMIATQNFSADDLSILCQTLYLNDAQQLDLSVSELFGGERLEDWFQAGCPLKTDIFSPGMLRLAMMPLLEQKLVKNDNILDRGAVTNFIQKQKKALTL
jgi:hypothetical protein